MTTASAPGKTILFGEHAVVSGVTALGGAIDLRAKVTLQDLPGKVLIETEDLALSGFSMDLITGQLTSSEAVHATRYVSAVLREFETRDISVKIRSDIPPAAGLGSSAAIVVATVAALNGHLGLGLSKKRDCIHRLPHRKAGSKRSGKPDGYRSCHLWRLLPGHERGPAYRAPPIGSDCGVHKFVP